MEWQEQIIREEDTGSRIDKYIQAKFGLSFGETQKFFRKNLVKINGQKSAPFDRLQSGQSVYLPSFVNALHDRDKTYNPEFASKLAPLIIYEDDKALVINKPNGLSVQSGSKINICIDDILTSYNHLNNSALKLVHRLDKSTSGALLIAKNREYASLFANLLKTKSIRKLYWAIVEGVPQKPEGVINIPIRKRLVGGQELMTEDHSESGLEAITKFKIIKTINANMSWLALMPITGRTHQLRIHCSIMGFPIKGDVKYGSRTKCSMSLHARRLCVHGHFDVLADPPSNFTKQIETITANNSINDFIDIKIGKVQKFV